MQSLGQGCTDNGLPFALGAQLWSVQQPLLHFGTPEQIQAFMPGLISGENIGCFAITEPNSGSDAFAIETTATRDGDDYILNGKKVMITLAPVANVAIIFAVTNPDAGLWGLSAFLVNTDSQKLTRSDNRPKMGLRTVPFGDITLDNVRVPCTSLLGGEGAGAAIFNDSQRWERCLVLAPQIGALRRLIQETVAFAAGHKRAGAAIGEHKSISHRIANMRISLEASSLMLEKCSLLLDQNRQCQLEAAIAKTFISESFLKACQDAVAIHGGAGFLTDSEIERHMRDAVGATLYGGTVDIQRNIIAGLTGL